MPHFRFSVFGFEKKTWRNHECWIARIGLVFLRSVRFSCWQWRMAPHCFAEGVGKRHGGQGIPIGSVYQRDAVLRVVFSACRTRRRSLIKRIALQLENHSANRVNGDCLPIDDAGCIEHAIDWFRADTAHEPMIGSKEEEEEEEIAPPFHSIPSRIVFNCGHWRTTFRKCLRCVDRFVRFFFARKPLLSSGSFFIQPWKLLWW